MREEAFFGPASDARVVLYHVWDRDSGGVDAWASMTATAPVSDAMDTTTPKGAVTGAATTNPAVGQATVVQVEVSRPVGSWAAHVSYPTPPRSNFAANAIRSPLPLTGTILAGEWRTFFMVGDDNVAWDGDVRMRYRYFKGVAPDGSDATETTSGYRTTSSSGSGFASGQTQALWDTAFNPGDVVFAGEYLFKVLALEVTTACPGAATGRRLRMASGPMAGRVTPPLVAPQGAALSRAAADALGLTDSGAIARAIRVSAVEALGLADGTSFQILVGRLRTPASGTNEAGTNRFKSL